MEKILIQAIKTAIPEITVYHDFAPDNAMAPFVVLQRVGGKGQAFIDYETKGGYQVRFQVAVWAAARLHALDLSKRIEAELQLLPTVAADGAGVSQFDVETELRSVVQDYLIWA